MKKILIVLSFFVAGAFHLGSKELKKTKEIATASSIKKESIKKMDASSLVLKSENEEAASLEEIEHDYKDLDIKDLELALDRIDKSREKLLLINAFNSRKLNGLEEKELTSILETKVVLTKLVLDKKFEEMGEL